MTTTDKFVSAVTVGAVIGWWLLFIWTHGKVKRAVERRRVRAQERESSSDE